MVPQWRDADRRCRMMAIYFYSSDTLDVSQQAVMVVFRTTDFKDDEAVEVMRDAADQIAELLAQGRQPRSVLYYHQGTMSALGPTDGNDNNHPLR